MMILLLIVVFSLLIVYQLVPVIEGNEEYQEYPDDPMILAKTNAGNIQVLKKRIDDIMGLKGTVDKQGTDLKALQEQVQAMVQAQTDAAADMTPEETPLIEDVE
jgi:hypothetical protein